MNSNKLNWVHWPDSKAVTKGMTNLSQFSSAYQKRKKQYPDYKPSKEALDIALKIEEKGYYKIENFLDINQIDLINKKVDGVLKDGNHPDNQNNISENIARNEKLYIQCLQPLISAPEIHPFVFNDLIIDIAGAYMDCYPAFGTCNLRRSFVNNMKEGGNQIYHVDPNSPRFLKFFIYLDDVDINGGPFCYVEGSHTKKFELNGNNLNTQYSWNTDTINQIYGEDKVKYLTAKKGDLLMADTNGWHRGTKPLNKDRTMLTLDYVCHVEFFQEDSKFKIKSEDYNKLEDKYKPLCDLLIKV